MTDQDRSTRPSLRRRVVLASLALGSLAGVAALFTGGHASSSQAQKTGVYTEGDCTYFYAAGSKSTIYCKVPSPY